MRRGLFRLLAPCPPPEGCTFQGLDPGILDVGLVFLSRPVRPIAPARLAQPGTLETGGATGKLMIVAGVVEFTDERRAVAFERCLKSGSGVASAKSHLR